MRYNIELIHGDQYCIADQKQTIGGGGNGGDAVCFSPVGNTWALSAAHWPENARRIVALLNAFDGITIEYIESMGTWLNEKHEPMQLPPEAHVEFADDKQPVKCRECGATSAIQCVQNNCHFMEA